MKALSIKQPWAELIVAGIKDIENRSWRTNFRGRVYVHASQKYQAGYGSLTIFTNEQLQTFDSSLKNAMKDRCWLTSAIIGEVDIIDCVKGHQSIWAIEKDDKGKEQWHWVLANAIKYDQPILNVNGGLSFWEYYSK
ncbi:hypothetical protein GCM10023149_48730 [Mucilaginibacter gynuensis]|uniref:ASCH domain-containing protein n=1 Tax=Mucilaginibacter gynuensis TaxID=1302236 RepID=A0ABP8HFG6_9SPHI